jgi:hypothetical protein
VCKIIKKLLKIWRISPNFQNQLEKKQKKQKTKTTYGPNGLRGLTVVKHVMYCGDLHMPTPHLCTIH